MLQELYTHVFSMSTRSPQVGGTRGYDSEVSLCSVAEGAGFDRNFRKFG
jgi:hypothetical protein